MEPKYRAAGVEPPRKPTWSGRLPFGNPSGSRAGLEVAKSDGLGDSRRVSLLLQSTPFFVVEGLGVKARVVVASAGMRDGMEGDGGGADSAPGASPSVSNVQQQQQQQPPSPSSSKKLQAPLAAAAAAAVLGAKRHALVERAVVRALAEVVHDECESREEEVLKAHLPEAQAYVVELEGYMSAIVRREALKAVATSPDGGSGPEIDDDLWRLFAVQETRLYSSSAALGKKPGRIYVTFDTLWFHSKVRVETFFFIIILFLASFCRLFSATSLDNRLCYPSLCAAPGAQPCALNVRGNVVASEQQGEPCKKRKTRMLLLRSIFGPVLPCRLLGRP